ncbi:hypothetical protein M5E86_00180 [Blautia wexlerae]|nr:hypothetical protein M5E86_00180 [Blautia wexlerae]
MWCPEEEKNEKEKREEKSMPALFMEINRQYGMRCMRPYTGNRYPAGTDADHYDRIQT